MNKKAQGGEGIVVGFVILFFIALIVCFMGFDTVSAGGVGVTTTFGEVGSVALEPGLHWTGVFTTTHDMTTRVQRVDFKTIAASKDLQNVPINIAVNYRLNPAKALNVYKTVGMDYANIVIFPIAQQSMLSATSQYTAEEITTKLPEVTSLISQGIISSFEDNSDIIITEVSIVDYDYSPEFNKAIEEKQMAEQEALKALNQKKQLITESEARAEKQKLEADANSYSIRVQAEAEAYALQIKREQLEKSRDLITYNAVEKWNGELPTYYTKGEGMLFNLPVEN